MLSAANTGEPLTAEGVAALASLRASAKRTGQTVGRFGVGFAAVAAVADEVVVASTTGAVRFSRALTAAAVAELPSLAAEVSARGGRVPLLRLPFPAEAVPLAEFTTEIRVTVRADAREAVQAMIDQVDPTLLLVLPGLTSLTVGDRTLTAEVDGSDVLIDGVRWRVVRGSGSLDPALLANRPVEEQGQTRWTATWAVPVEPSAQRAARVEVVLGLPLPAEGGVAGLPLPVGVAAGVPLPLPAGVAAVLRAPTPTDDPMSLPALLSASLPLGPDRRRVQPGGLTDEVLRQAAELLVELVSGLELSPSRLTFVPGPLGSGEIDARLGSAVLQAFRSSTILGVKAADAIVLEGANPELVALLEDLLSGLLPHSWSATRWSAPLRALGARRMSLAELTELLAGIERPAAWWGRLYAALPPDVDQLGSLPVPTVGGRLAPSPRGLLIADAAIDLSVLGFRVVEPDAAHDLLLRLGAVHTEARTLLEDPRVRAAVEAALDDDSFDASSVHVSHSSRDESGLSPLSSAVLALVGAADLRPGDLPWLAGVLLPTVEGDDRPAGELLLPSGPMASVVDLDAGFGVVADGVAHPDVLAALGVLRGFAAVQVEDAQDADLVDDWLGSLTPGVEPGLVVRDLDLVRPDAWASALEILAADDLLTPYALWWLSRHPVLDGHCPRDLLLKGSAPELVGLLDETSHPLAARLGVVTGLGDVDPAVLLEGLADENRDVSREAVRVVHAHLSQFPDLPLPLRVRAVLDGKLAVVPAEDALVVDRPDLLPRVLPYAVVPVPLESAADLADALDLSLASEVLEIPALQGKPTPWGEASGGYVVHDKLEAPTAGGELVPVAWIAAGEVDHVVGPPGMARALAWRLGDWSLRHALEARFRGGVEDPEADLDSV